MSVSSVSVLLSGGVLVSNPEIVCGWELDKEDEGIEDEEDDDGGTEEEEAEEGIRGLVAGLI